MKQDADTMTGELPLKTVAALFVRRDSVYKNMPQVDPWDADRDARAFGGACR